MVVEWFRQVDGGHPGLVVELHPLVGPTFPFSYVKKGVEWSVVLKD